MWKAFYLSFKLSFYFNVYNFENNHRKDIDIIRLNNLNILGPISLLSQ